MKSDSPSSTAKVIAASTIHLYYSGETDLVPKEAVEWCEKFLSTTLGDRLFAWTARNPVTRFLLRLIEQATLPGIVRHYWLRKNAIEAEVRSSLNSGEFKNVVIIGGGFDTLAMRNAQRYARIHWIELDHPATQKVKSQVIRSERYNNYKLIPLDLGTARATWPDLPTDSIVVLEGLLMYFTVDQVRQIITWASGDSAKNQIVATYMEQLDDQPAGFRPRSRFIDWWLALRDEPFLWSLKNNQLDTFLEPLGYKPEKMITTSDMRALYTKRGRTFKPSSLRGENMFVAGPAPALKHD